jgi:hypothetical protein
VRPKQFLSLWYVRRKLCTYLTSRLALSLDVGKQASTFASPPWSTIGRVQDVFGAVHWAQAMHLSCTDTNTISERTEMRFHMIHVT